jgi:hypothetical protein
MRQVANRPLVRARIAELRVEHQALHNRRAKDVAPPLVGTDVIDTHSS